MKSVLRAFFVLAVAGVFLFAGSAAFAAPNPEGTKDIKQKPEKVAPPKASKKEKKYDWLEIKVGLYWQYDDNVVLLNEDKNLVPDYSTDKLVTTVTLRATPFKKGNWKFGAQYDFYNAAHSDVEYMEIQTHSLLLFGFWSKRPSYLYFPLSANMYLLDNTTYLNTVRFSPTFYYEQSNKWLGSVTLSAEVLNYKLASDDMYDAVDYLVRFSETYLLKRDTWFKGYVSYNYLKADEQYVSYAGPKVFLGFHTKLLWDVEGELSASYHYRDYRLENPTTHISRVDKRTIFNAVLRRPFGHGISAFARYTYVENNSNETNYDYSRNIITFGIEWRY